MVIAVLFLVVYGYCCFWLDMIVNGFVYGYCYFWSFMVIVVLMVIVVFGHDCYGPSFLISICCWLLVVVVLVMVNALFCSCLLLFFLLWLL